MSRQIISLNDNQWQCGRVTRRPFSASNLFDVSAVRKWHSATVPGNVRSDLLALGRIPDPFGDNPEAWKDSLWVEDVDWWYRRTINADLPTATSRAFLLFHGIDYLSAIFINGQEVARHEGMFSRQRVEITEALRHGPVELAVRVWGSGALPKRKLNPLQKAWKKFGGKLYRSWLGIYPDRTATLKCQMSFGWDFAPPIRTMGIWDDVELIITGPVCVSEFSVQSSELIVSNQPSAVRFQVSIDTVVSLPITAAVTFTPANFGGDTFGPFQFDLHLPKGNSRLTLRCPKPPLKTWQPWERGFPHLYNVTLTLTQPDGTVWDKITQRTGFRSDEAMMRGGEDALNTLRTSLPFVRGLNWVPADSLPGRLRRTDYERLLSMAKAANANLLRVWGGGLREKRAFYDLCDELGLLVWQEFPFSCEFLGAFPRDAEYLAFVESECGDIVRQLRHHPSLTLWCGGNEFSHSRNRPLLNTLARVVRRFDGARPFLPTSPGPDDSHNWHVWHGEAPLSTYQKETAPLISEFGLQSISNEQSAINNYQLSINKLEDRYADVPKLARYTTMFNEQLPVNNYQFTVHNYSPRNEVERDSELAQATALQVAIEHMRRNKGKTVGTCVWQFNEPWPAVSWSIVDYSGRPKLAYEWLKDLYNPVLVCLEFPVGHRYQPGDSFSAAVWIINDTARSISNYQLIINKAPMSVEDTEVLPNSARSVGQIEVILPVVSPPHLSLALVGNGKTLSQNQYYLNWRDLPPAPVSLKFRRWVAEWALR